MKKICLKLPEHRARQLKIQAAQAGCTAAQWVAYLVAQEEDPTTSVASITNQWKGKEREDHADDDHMA
jgi:hypothetical protein